MMYSDIPSAQTLVLYFKSRGIQNIVISPGSRNAPLTLSFTKNPFFKCFSIVDERCAGFFALGMAQQLQKPVALVCTSGSALLNYYPAVAEAFYSDIPLIVVSADRPNYKIDVGDGQTIRQENVFERHIGFQANVKQDVSHATETMQFFLKDGFAETQEEIQKYNEIEIAAALDQAILECSPVHINIPFEEPLYGQADEVTVRPPEVFNFPLDTAEVDNLERLVSIWNTSKRKMILVGVNAPNTIEASIINSLASDDSILVFTETTSNLHHPNFFPSIDSIIAPIEKSERQEELFQLLQPDLLVTFGGLIVSKKIKAFLRKYQPNTHWHIDTKKAYDTFFCLSEHVKLNPNEFFKSIFNQEAKRYGCNYRTYWDGVKNKYLIKREGYLKQIDFSDFSAFNSILKSIPSKFQVHLANSSTVRYAQLFPMDKSLRVYCNRGTSGIDGSTSTAVGASIHNEPPTLLITGDLSFFYDSNGLWNEYIKSDFRIIIINNSGGGIFRILPGSEETNEFSTFFETNHEHTAEHLAKMHKFDYKKVDSLEKLESSLLNFYDVSENPKVLEIMTPRLLNDKILLGYFDFIS
ncbi:2-succinyl-5-enolpyruvyl-6-hydroxy-3-cyclohexene-1-carboxylic-acid synthase [Flagellimonas eckloniae]|uniref:2-succinyl-5-enolpyruvyl-6-hydroxy-3-cyclohexene-1-carboxylate synthase n=1 Tax=Flagellimonas eckloniae TaxID=346185 RepID=A0A0Q1H6J8_9FLAO|nr:2-succinyl-5-enolpyruvyl-6-hydroxy-3-cyclohexene-1-carboxylic-acid synthase [Allomuricauda eckloniae]KQC29278.1 2-succinyl-5-enolpyruvyl-6-hydroxy-3-cyclohexene-1-carboxylate synthase [Allomuricauda eckloniae]